MVKPSKSDFTQRDTRLRDGGRSKSKRRAKAHKGSDSASSAIVVPDVIFALEIHDVTARLVFEHGIPILLVDNMPYRVPGGIQIPTDANGTDVDVTIRNITNEVILNQGEDDYYEDDLSSDDRLFPIESTDDLEEIYNERKIQLFSKLGGSISTFFGGLFLCLACLLLKRREFFLPVILDAGIVAGITLGVILGAIPVVRGVRGLSSRFVADCAGNWVNMDTGETNLNGGIRIPKGKHVV